PPSSTVVPMHLTRILRWAVAACLLLAALAWVLVRRVGLLPPAAGAVLAMGAALAASAVFVQDLRALRSKRRWSVVGSGLLFGGIAFAGGAGMVGWARSIQGYLLLAEGEPSPVSTVEDLQKHWGGPLGSVAELRGTVLLDRLLLEPVGRGFEPVSHVVARTEDGAERRVDVSPARPGVVGGLHLYQGAFGFAPRIVVKKGARTLFEGHVPFRTRLLERRAVAFDGEVDVPEEGLHVTGEVDLSTLDERMRGHPTLLLRVEKGGRELGGGALTPGHFADVGEGYAIGYAGMRRWSEVDVRRAGMARWVRAGLLASAAGLLLWLIATWRRW
ncbi:MAG TPA: hypothetical protein VLT61_14930, partial [Anaeromyxobacteraceae bacterium]|nr:hypothetical protein [Anaeromyxobacteraceae bacterium]